MSSPYRTPEQAPEPTKLSPREEWEMERDRRQALCSTEWKCLEAWWTAYQAYLPQVTPRVLQTVFVRDFAAAVEAEYRARRQACIDACTKICEGFPSQPPPSGLNWGVVDVVGSSPEHEYGSK